MPNRFELLPTGKTTAQKSDIVTRIKTQWENKSKIYSKRASRVTEIKNTMEALLPIGEYVMSQNSAKSVKDLDDMFFSSAFLHTAFNFLTNTKLDPDFTDFSAEITVDPKTARPIERNIGKVHSFARRKGDYEKAVNDSAKDLIFGESYKYRDYEVNDKGENVKLKWKHLPWEDVRQPYYDTDWIVRINWSVDGFVKRYGKAMLKKVTLGGIVDIKDVSSDSIDIERMDEYRRDGSVIQEVIYVDPAQKVFAKIMGGSGYEHTLLEGDAFPFKDDDGTTFAPIKKRVFYKPTVGFHGWGVMDLLLPVAKLDTIIANATANRAVLAADPLVVMATNNPDDMQKKWKQHLRNRSTGKGVQTPFFVQDTNSGTKVTPQNVDVGVNNGNFQTWNEYLIQEATMRTGIDFRVLTEYAPTAEQQRLRKQEEDKVNLGVLRRNKESDASMAKEDLYFLRNTTSEFHNLTVYLEPMGDAIENLSAEDEALVKEDGEFINVPMTIAEFFDSLGNIEFDISPRLEGALDDQTFLELQEKKENLQLIPQGTKAYNKALVKFLQETTPAFKITEEDLQPDIPEPVAPVEAPAI